MNCPFTEFYSKEQLIYQRYNNEQFNTMNETVYFSGAFVQKNIFFDYMKGIEFCNERGFPIP